MTRWPWWPFQSYLVRIHVSLNPEPHPEKVPSLKPIVCLESRPSQQETYSSNHHSNHHFSGAILVIGRIFGFRLFWKTRVHFFLNIGILGKSRSASSYIMIGSVGSVSNSLYLSWRWHQATDPMTGLILTWVFPKIMVSPNHPLKNRVFHYKPSILGCFPFFGNTQICYFFLCVCVFCGGLKALPAAYDCPYFFFRIIT